MSLFATKIYKPIIIIGAPRSGTNMLRDVLCSLETVGTWPCDEINYIWRHGNIRENSDEFGAEMATPNVSEYIQKQFDKLAEKDDLRFVVEKTCANSLRVDFIDQILPEAHYIFITRNGLDVVASANLRWVAKLDIPYLFKKVKYVPLQDLPFYTVRYIWSHIYRKFSGERRLAFWGPKLKNMKSILREHSLNEICAIQWARCIESSDRSFSQLPSERVTKVRYEDFVDKPDVELARICKDLNIVADDKIIMQAVQAVSNKSVGKWKKQLDKAVVEKLKPLIKDTMEANDYNDHL